MHLQSMHIRNFRRLVDVAIDLESQTTVFVGSNNSGKTSATQIFRCFLDPTHPFTFHDFSANCWDSFDQADKSGSPDTNLPSITLDLWFQVSEVDLHKVVNILPSLDWSDQPLGIRFEFVPKDPTNFLMRYRSLRDTEIGSKQERESIRYWPESVTDYLRKELRREYHVRHYTIEADARVDGRLPSDYVGVPLGDSTDTAARIVNSLLKVDFLDAQRFLSDADSRGRSQDLSRRLSSFYKRNLEQLDLTTQSRQALARSEQNFNAHLDDVFKDTLTKLSNLGYPGIHEPKLLIRSNLDSEQVVTQNASVHYQLDSLPTDSPENATPRTLPDRYSGLGFKNLIYMVVELLDFRAQCTALESDMPALHLILIEEPEVHLHVQLQQVFIKKIFSVVASDAADIPLQMIVSTHSPHIIDENDYEIVRYFKRHDPKASIKNATSVLNLADLNEQVGDQSFLKRYLKITHCDLFFADGAVLVEGNVERMLLPLMIDRDTQHLSTSYLSILEVGGAFAHKFAPLIELLGIPTLIITDLDSVDPAANRKTCLADTPGAVSSNSTITTWLPNNVDELLATPDEAKVVPAMPQGKTHLRLAYQNGSVANTPSGKIQRTGRTFEEAFIFDNFAWVTENQALSSTVGFDTIPNALYTPEEYIQLVHDSVRKDFKKTQFALQLLTSDQMWTTPGYIKQGLEWLDKRLSPDIESDSPESQSEELDGE